MWVLRLSVLLLWVVLAGCKLSSPKTETPVAVTTYSLQITMTSTNLVDADSFPNTDTVSVKVRLLDGSNNAVSGQLVKVASSLGTLASATVLTDASGYGETTISPSKLSGAGTITATFDKATATSNFELVAAPTTAEQESLAIVMSSTNQVDSDSFPNSDEINIAITLLDAANKPLAGQLIKVATSYGTLVAATVLTNDLGVATAKMSASALIGAGTITATYSAVTAVKNFELLTSTPTVSLPSLQITMSSTNPVDADSFPNSDTVSVKVRLLDGSNNPVSGQLVKLAASLGTLASATVLTDATGYGETTISPSKLSGAGTITATFDKATATSNFELVAAPIAAEQESLAIVMSSPNQVDGDSFPNSDEINIAITLLDAANKPLAGQLIKVATSYGTLEAATVLTNDVGVATAKMPASVLIGAGAITATYSAVTAVKNFELLTSTPTVSLPSLQIAMSSANQLDSDSFPNTDEVAIAITLLDAQKAPIKGQLVAVVTSVGELSAETALTNDNGIATAKVVKNSDLGAGAITASYGGQSAKYNFELVNSAPVTPEASPTMALSILSSNLPVSRFKSDDNIRLHAVVNDGDGSPLANVIVKFTVELGTLSVASALTDAQGVAEVNLASSNANLGAAVATATATIDALTINKKVNYEVLDSAITVTQQVIQLGHFDDSNQFVAGSLGSSIAPDSNGVIDISAGASLGLTLALVDGDNQRIMTPTQVTFSSTCVSSQKARIDASVGTINGVASSTYEDTKCGGGEDQIVASVTVNNQTSTLSQTVRIASESVGSIEFVSASPNSIVLKGTGGLGQQEASTLTFLVKGALGNPLAQQPVTFSLNTSAGDLSLAPASSLTNSSGLVTTRVSAGNVPTSVRVTAALTTSEGQVIKTQSDLLSVNTGMPDQDSFTLSAETYNPEADSYNGVEDLITVQLSDSFNNPVPDGTTVNFTTEGGSIVPSCNTQNGACTVKWTSGEPRVSDHRVTILATAVGHETFYDTNGTNTFDDDDGVGLTSLVESGLGRLAASASGFFDMSEAWRDDNENAVHDSGEKFIDFNNNQLFDVNDTLFNGPQCTGSLCGTGDNQSIHVRKAIVLIMSGSRARLTLMSETQAGTNNTAVTHVANRYVYRTNDVGNVVVDGAVLSIAEDQAETFTLTFADFGGPHGQTLPAGTRVVVTTSVGTLSGTTEYEVPNGSGGSDPNAYNGQEISFAVTNTNTVASAGDSPLNGTLTISVTTPEEVVTPMTFPFALQGL